MHPTLHRLDQLAQRLSAREDVVAVLGLGSAGIEYERFDEHSDIDCFVVVDDHDAKHRYLADIDWLSGFGGRVAYSFANDRNGRKALFGDGLFVEFAVFTPTELEAVPFVGARVVWQRPGAALDLDRTSAPPPATSLDTVEFHLNEALTNLYVGLHRERRGERLTAMRFIQVFAVDRVLALLRLDQRDARHGGDPFEPTRRIEQMVTAGELPLAQLAPGYPANDEAVAATLDWLTSRYDADPVVVDAVRALLSRSSPAADARPT